MIATPRTMTEAIAMRSQKEREDFAARVRGEHPDQKAFRQYLRAELRLAYRRLRLHTEAIKEAAKMVEEGVDPEVALSCLGDALDYVIPTAPEKEPDTSDIPEADEKWFREAKLVLPPGGSSMSRVTDIHWSRWTESDCREAAAEIERLRKQLEECQEGKRDNSAEALEPGERCG